MAVMYVQAKRHVAAVEVSESVGFKTSPMQLQLVKRKRGMSEQGMT